MGGKELQPGRETQPRDPYFRAARYVADGPAFAAYSLAQDLIFSNSCDLSAYRIRYRDVPHVVLLGGMPEPEIDQKIGQILETGEPADLPQDIMKTLSQRRAQARQIGPWVEGHYRPGKNM
jgi:hypothetical protein